MRSAGVDPDTARQALDRLVTRGLVEKVPGEPGAWVLTAEGLPAEERPSVAPAVAPVSADRWNGTGPRWWPTTVARRPRYYPEPGKVPEKVLLAFEAFPGGARPKDISAFMGQDVSNRISELMTYGVLVKDGHGLYRLATTPPAPTGSGPLSEAKPASEPAGEAGGGAGEATGGADLSPAVGTQVLVPTTAAETDLIAELAKVREAPVPVWKAVGEVVGTLGGMGPGWWGPLPVDWSERVVKFIHATTADRDRLRGLASSAYNTLYNLRALLRLPSDANLDVEAPRIGADMAAVRLLVQARDDETLEAAVVRHIAKSDLIASCADAAALKAESNAKKWEAGGWSIFEQHAAKAGHLDAIRKALAEGGEAADLSDLLLAPAVRALVKQVKSLEKVAQRQPVAPGPRLLHPLEHPAVTAATVAAVGKLCCDADHCAVDDLRDAFATDDDATPAEVVAVVLASRKADHAAIAELRAELADTRRRLTLAQCDASAQRAKVERGLGQRLLAAIRRGVGA